MDNIENIIPLVVLGLTALTGVVEAFRSRRETKRISSREKVALTCVNSKDSQIQELALINLDLLHAVEQLTNITLTGYLNSTAVRPSAKVAISEYAGALSKLPSLKIDTRVANSIEKLDELDKFSVSEEKKEKIQAVANQAQDVLNTIGEKASKLVDNINYD